MVQTRFHINPNSGNVGKCSAKPGGCPFRNEDNTEATHYFSKVEALKASEEIQKEKVGAFKKQSKNKNKYTDHIEKAEKKIKKLEKELKERDARQFTGTVNASLEKSFSKEDIDKMLSLETRQREAGLGFMNQDNGERVIGVTYGGDFRAEEEYGISFIAKSLENGDFEKNDVQYLEEKGKGFLIVRGENMYGLDNESVAKNFKEASERLDKYDFGSYQLRWKLERKKFQELKDEYSEVLKPAPKTKKEAISRILEKENEGKLRVPQGEFHDGRVLVIASDNPVMNATMKKVKEAHDNGSLRVGSSSNPFSRGIMFYDERDLNRNTIEAQVREDEYDSASFEYAKDTRDKLEKNGTLYAIRNGPLRENETGDVRNSKFYINYYTGSVYDRSKRPAQVYGWFNKEQLEEIADGNIPEEFYKK